MKILFNNLQEVSIEHFYGGDNNTEAKMFSDKLNRIMSGRLKPGASIGLHSHETSSEIIFITAGTATAIYDDEKEILNTGDCHYCPKGHRHSIINSGTEDLVFFAVVPEQ